MRQSNKKKTETKAYQKFQPPFLMTRPRSSSSASPTPTRGSHCTTHGSWHSTTWSSLQSPFWLWGPWIGVSSGANRKASAGASYCGFFCQWIAAEIKAVLVSNGLVLCPVICPTRPTSGSTRCCTRAASKTWTYAPESRG